MWVIPDFGIWFFFSREKNLGEQKFACLLASDFLGGILFTVLLPVTHRVPDTFEIANYLGKNTVQRLKFSSRDAMTFSLTTSSITIKKT